MKQKLNTITISLAGALALALIVSALFFFLGGESGTRERVLFFPLYRTADFRGEVRELPKKNTREDDIRLLVEEIILGPFNIHHDPILPEESDVRSVMFRDNTLYIDFSIDVIFQREESILSLKEVLNGIRHSITYNFPSVQKIVFSVRGEIPEAEKTKQPQSS